MFLPDGSQGLIFNGEIYNYKGASERTREFGSDLSFRVRYRGGSLALATWGEEAFQKFNGMWAIAWIDLGKRTLLLSPRPIGIKPLYLCWRDGDAFFASEIKAIPRGKRETLRSQRANGGTVSSAKPIRCSAGDFLFRNRGITRGSQSKTSPRRRHVARILLERYWRMAGADSSLNYEQAIEAVRATFYRRRQIATAERRSGWYSAIWRDGFVLDRAAMRYVLGRDADLHAISAVSGRPEYDEGPFIEAASRHLACPVHYVQLRFNPAEWFRFTGSGHLCQRRAGWQFLPRSSPNLSWRSQRLGITVLLSGQGADETCAVTSNSDLLPPAAFSKAVIGSTP